MAEDLISIILSQPWIYLLGTTLIIYLIVDRYMSGKQRPEEKPYFGAKVRKEMTEKEIVNRSKIWGQKANLHLKRGMENIGKIIKVETFFRNNKKKSDIEQFHIIIFRQYGFIAWLKATILSRFEKVIVNPAVMTKHKDFIALDPLAHLIDDSGVWVLSTEKGTEIVDDLNLKKDLENIKGFVSDMPRRLSNIHPSQAMFTERQDQDAKIEKEKKQSLVSKWQGKN